MDKSGPNKATVDGIIDNRCVPIEVRQIRYLSNFVEKNHRAVKHLTRTILNFKAFRSDRNVLAGIELVHIIRKGQMAEEIRCLLQNNFMRWQDKSVQFSELAICSSKICVL